MVREIAIRNNSTGDPYVWEIIENSQPIGMIVRGFLNFTFEAISDSTHKSAHAYRISDAVRKLINDPTAVINVDDNLTVSALLGDELLPTGRR